MGSASRSAASAAAKSPASAAANIRAIAGPTTWPATDTTPTPPARMKSRVRWSSPEYQARPVRAMRSLAWATLPVASFTATIVSTCARVSIASSPMGMPVRPGMS